MKKQLKIVLLLVSSLLIQQKFIMAALTDKEKNILFKSDYMTAIMGLDLPWIQENLRSININDALNIMVMRLQTANDRYRARGLHEGYRDQSQQEISARYFGIRESEKQILARAKQIIAALKGAGAIATEKNEEWLKEWLNHFFPSQAAASAACSAAAAHSEDLDAPRSTRFLLLQPSESGSASAAAASCELPQGVEGLSQEDLDAPRSKRFLLLQPSESGSAAAAASCQPCCKGSEDLPITQEELQLMAADSLKARSAVQQTAQNSPFPSLDDLDEENDNSDDERDQNH